MGQLLVRNLDDSIVEALRARAEKRGRSVEEEHRRILKRALFPKPKRSLKEMLLAIPKSSGPEEDALFEEAIRRDSADMRPDPFEEDE